MSIPKILHFTWKTADVPGKMGDYLKLWRKLHPDWDVRLWTDAAMRDFVAERYPDFLGRYDAYPKPIQRADSYRYLVLAALGGVYSDLDVEPFRPIDGLIEGLDCFAGLEPDEHMGPDRRHSGTPFLLSNAFMGAVPGHPYFVKLVERLPIVADIPEVFLSTGPSLTTGTAVRIPRAQRPVLVPPCLWSPHCDGGRPCMTDDRLHDLLKADFDFVWADRKAFVSHHWLTSWVPWHKRHKWLARPFHAWHNAKWALRALRHPELAEVPIRDPLYPYSDQTPKPPGSWPGVAICISLPEGGDVREELAASLGALDYAKDKLSVFIGSYGKGEVALEMARASVKRLKEAGFGRVEINLVSPFAERGYSELTAEHRAMVRSARLRNALAETAMLEAEWLLFIGGEVSAVPPQALKAALSAGLPVVALAMRDVRGQETDPAVFRYQWGGGIRTTWKIRGADGLADPARGQRDYLGSLRAFRLIPLDGVGRGFVLVKRDVLEAHVRFAETPFALHLDGEGFALMARGAGFEVAGLTGMVVTLLAPPE